MTPLEILLREFLPDPARMAVEAEVAKIESLPPVRPIGDLRVPDWREDPTELLRSRFLYRGGVCLLIGPTGVGKSALLVQLGLHWALGRELFGLCPGACYRESGLRVLLVQAENDEGDLAEMCAGVLAGSDDLSDQDRARACAGLKVVTICDRAGDRFCETLDALLGRAGPFDLVMVDPAFAYLGGDANAQVDVSRFMRELLNPLLQRHQVGLLLAHHVNKPMRGREKEDWAAGDYAYLGAGSAEWINPARAALAIRSVGSESVFEFRAPKRGKRLRWTGPDGLPTTVRHIAHDGRPGVICWRDATAEEIAGVTGGANLGGRPRGVSEIECVHAVAAMRGVSQSRLAEAISVAVGVSDRAARRALAACASSGWLTAESTGGRVVYVVTAEGEAARRRTPAAVDWAGVAKGVAK